MKPNTNPTTGISYGVVSFDSLQDWIWEEFETHGCNLTDEAIEADWREENGDIDLPDDFWDHTQTDECCYSLETQDGMKLEVSWLGGAPLVWVLESPHTANCDACSPCVPGAGDLDNKRHELNGNPGVVAYDLPADWYRQED